MQTLVVNAGDVTVIVDGVLSFAANPSVPHPVVGQVYPATSIGTISGGTAPYTISGVSGQPAGMSLAISGNNVNLSGTPTSAGTSQPTFTLKDSAP